MSTERARSLSPTKDSPSRADTLGSTRSGKKMSAPEELPPSENPTLEPPSSGTPILDDTPRRANGVLPNNNTQEIETGLRGLPQPPSKYQTASDRSVGIAMPLSRAGTLSWQQRPSSRGSTGQRSRPVSMFASGSDPPESRQESTDGAGVGDSISRGQIAQSLGAKDPTWFMQTQDRGLGSAAYRKNQEDNSDTASVSGSMRLPGMSRESTIEPENRMSPPMTSVRSNSPYEYPIPGISRQSLGHSTTASISSAGGVRSPLPTLESQVLEPPSSDTASSFGGDSSIGRPLAMSPSQGRISPERIDRPISPTKGLGGFVQSAMMKRSDSVNKRWSAQAGPGLSRGNSVVSDASSYGATRYSRGGITPLVESMPNSISRENTPVINSRPESSQSNATLTRSPDEKEKLGSLPFLPDNKAESVLNDNHGSLERGTKPSPPENEMNPPASPSKKWSPSKASWLENAIKKPDSPRARLPAPQQPAWMADIARAKQQRGSVDLSKGSSFKEVATGGLVRSPPPGAGFKPPSMTGLSSSISAGLASKPQAGTSDDISRERLPPEPENQNAGPPASPPAQVPSAAQSENETRPIESRTSPKSKKGLTDSPPVEKIVSSANAHMTSPTVPKTKPETPPRRDFKSTLKPRSIGAEIKDKDEPEFKNVFGKLKRTQTQNYVAPDEFKDNIMRGKAGLAQTGGPKKTERKDEFKESILQKKQKMVAPSASTRITSASSKIPDQTTPEAIAKRNALTKPESITSNGNADNIDQTTDPETLPKLQHLRDKPEPPTNKVGASAFSSKDVGPKGVLGGNFASSLTGILQRGPTSIKSKPTAIASPGGIAEKTSLPAANTEPSSPGPQLTHATKARAKGPKRRLPTASKQSLSLGNELSAGTSDSNQILSENQSVGASIATKPRSSISKPSTSESRPLSNITNSSNSNRKISQPNSPRKPSTSISTTEDFKPVSPVSQKHNREIQINSPPVVKQKPFADSKANKTPDVLSSSPKGLSDTLSRQPDVQGRRPSAVQSPSEQPNRGNVSPEPETSLPSVRDAAALWGQAQMPAQQTQPKSPIKLSTSKDQEAALEKATLEPNPTVSLDFKAPTRVLNSQQDRNGTSPAIPSPKSPKSPPLPGKKPASITVRAASTHLSPTKMTQASRPILTKSSYAPELFANIFDEYPTSSATTNVDTQTAVNCRASGINSQKIKTLRKQIFEVSSNGKSIPVPSQQEHILFEESLYLCTHIFGTPSGQRTTEVYLWCGDGVSSASVEDAQLFAKKVAKDANGQLIVLKQGKETTNFFQALGGIVITRRGSSRRAPSKSSGTGYILCGRQHVGQIAFDEVDYSPQSLCTGFPYIVCTPSGKLYLWKGAGSGADELGCARLIGMDLGLTGDIEEIDENREPDAFWHIFAEGKRSIATSAGSSPQHWHLKPCCENYSTRLFATDSEAQRPKSSTGFMSWGRRGSAPSNDANAASAMQIKEIMPFAQSDLVDGGVFVLDAFFEVFVWVLFPTSALRHTLLIHGPQNLHHPFLLSSSPT